MVSLPLLPRGCPPDDAVPSSGDFFRLVGKDVPVGGTPGADDWVLPYRKAKGPCMGKIDECLCHSHSLFADITDARLVIKLIPAFRNKLIAKVTLTPNMGRIKHTPREKTPSHYSWWPATPDLVPTATVVG